MAGLNICPYCGSPEVHVSEWFDSDSGEPSYYVACDKCGYEAETKQPTYEEAVDHWNRRASLIFIMPTRVKRAYTAILFRKSKEHQSYIFKVNSKSACIEHWLYA